jgi:hypothetical protein
MEFAMVMVVVDGGDLAFTMWCGGLKKKKKKKKRERKREEDCESKTRFI